MSLLKFRADDQPSRRRFLLTASGATGILLPVAASGQLPQFFGFPPCGVTPKFLEEQMSRPLTGSHITSDGAIWFVGGAGSDTAIYKSTNDGQTWTNPAVFPNTFFESLSFVEDSKGHFFISPWSPTVSASERGILRSTDRGNTWTRVLDLSSYPNQAGIWGVDLLPNGSMFAGVYSDGTQFACSIYRSSDFGATWSLAFNNPKARHIHAITADQSSGYVYATYGDNFAPFNSNGILRSTDGGHTWVNILTTLPQMVAALATPTARIFGTDDPTQAGLFRTTDDKSAQLVLSENNLFCYWLRRDPQTSWIYSGFTTNPADTNPTLAKIYVSKDDGKSWALHSLWPSVEAFDGTGFASNIVNGKISCHMQGSGQELNGVLLNTQRKIGYLTRPVAASLIAEDGSIYYTGIAGSDSNVYRSRDNGISWSTSATFKGQTFESRCFTQNILGDLFFSPWGLSVNDATRGLWITRDQGRSWSRVVDTSAFPAPSGFWAIDSFIDGSMYAGLYSEGPQHAALIMRSSDYGNSWVQAYFDPIARHIHGISIEPWTGHVYATYGDSEAPWFSKGILRSADRGKSWNKILPTLPQMAPVLATGTCRLFATDDPTQTGIYRTTDDQTAQLVLSDVDLFAFWLRKDFLTGIIYAGFVSNSQTSAPTPAYGKIYSSSNDGVTWSLHSLWPAVIGFDGPNFASNILFSSMAININYDGNEQNGALLSLC